MINKSARRCDDDGRAFAGSQLQIQAYVNRCRQDLDTAILAVLPEAFGTASIDWRSPLEAQRFAEFMNGRFVDALDLTYLRPQLRKFWPRSGPRWDGLARICRGDTAIGYLLVEAKSYPDELLGRGCGAIPETDSHRLIKASLAAVVGWAKPATDAKWLGSLYQYANRLAHVFFLQEATQLPTWLVNLCFVGDPHRKTSRGQWTDGLSTIKKDLGFDSKPVPHTLDVLIEALPDARKLLGAAPA